MVKAPTVLKVIVCVLYLLPESSTTNSSVKLAEPLATSILYQVTSEPMLATDVPEQLPDHQQELRYGRRYQRGTVCDFRGDELHRIRNPEQTVQE